MDETPRAEPEILPPNADDPWRVRRGLFDRPDLLVRQRAFVWRGGPISATLLVVAFVALAAVLAVLFVGAALVSAVAVTAVIAGSLVTSGLRRSLARRR